MSCSLLSDSYLFPAIQLVLIVFAVTCAVLDWQGRRNAGSGGVGLQITRGAESMAILYGAYAVLTGVFVSLSLTVTLAENYRVLFVVLDVLLIAYVCIINQWFRNMLVGWADRLTRVERR